MSNTRKAHVGKTPAQRREYIDNYVKPATQEPTLDTVRPSESTTSVTPENQAVEAFPTRPRSRGIEPLKKWFHENAVLSILTGVVVIAIGIVGYLWMIIFQLNREVGEMKQQVLYLTKAADDAKAAARETEDRILKQIDKLEIRLDQAKQQPTRR